MFKDRLIKFIGNVVQKDKKEVFKRILALEESHKKCIVCNIVGHKEDMYEEKIYGGFFTMISYSNYYHNGCYAEKSNKHLCPCKCGKWIDNKVKKCK